MLDWARCNKKLPKNRLRSDFTGGISLGHGTSKRVNPVHESRRFVFNADLVGNCCMLLTKINIASAIV